MFFSKRSKHKKSARSARAGYRPEVLALEDRVVPSTAGLDALVHPAGHAAAVVNVAPASDQGIGDQVSAKADALQDARTPDGAKGIGSDLSAFVQTLVPPAESAGDSGHQPPTGGDDTDHASGAGQGIGAQVSAKAHELQDARTPGGAQGIGAELSAFVRTLVPAKADEGNSGHQPSTNSDAAGQPSAGQGIGDQVSAKAQELQAARTPDGAQGIGADLSAFVRTLVPATADVGDSTSSSAPAIPTAAHEAPTLPDAAGDGIAIAAAANASSQAPVYSPIFQSVSSANATVTLPAEANNGIATATAANASSQADEHSPIFESDASASDFATSPAFGEDEIATTIFDSEIDWSAAASPSLPDAAEDGIATAAAANASSEAADHSPVFDADSSAALESSAGAE